MRSRPRPLVLCILDGWGERPKADDNAIETARTPHWHRLITRWPHSHLQASEHYVGLPDGQMGNSEVGHTNIGAGRVVFQDLPRIDAAIAEGRLATMPAIAHLCQKAQTERRDGSSDRPPLPGGVHSHQHQIAALARIVAEAGLPVAVHAFLDGRDTPAKIGRGYLTQFRKEVAGSRPSGGRHGLRALLSRWTVTSAGIGWKKPMAAIVRGSGEKAGDADPSGRSRLCPRRNRRVCRAHGRWRATTG